MTTSEILTRARRTFTEWPRGMCVYTVIGDVVSVADGARHAPVADLSDEFRAAVKLYADVATGTPCGEAIWRWYDTPGRTLQDVLDAFDAAIAIAQQQERMQGETTAVADDHGPASR